MSASCVFRAYVGHHTTSAFGGKAAFNLKDVMSAFDPKRTWLTAKKVLVLQGRLKNPNRCGIAASRTGSQEESIELWNIE